LKSARHGGKSTVDHVSAATEGLGQMNIHPKSAMEFLEGNDKDNLMAFYDEIVGDG
jgi:hypothetical protein